MPISIGDAAPRGPGDERALTKVTKAAGGLRALILSGVLGKSPCPNGIDISIEAGREQGSWLAFVIPPAQGEWADCAKLIAQITRRLQREYELPTHGS